MNTYSMTFLQRQFVHTYVASWFGFKTKSNSESTLLKDSQLPQSENLPADTPTATENASLFPTQIMPRQIFAADGTSFEVVILPGHESEDCGKVGGPFVNVDGQRHDVYRLAEAL